MLERNITTKDVLSMLGVGSFVVASLIFPGLPVAVLKTSRYLKGFNTKNLGIIIKRLEKQNLISIKEDDGQVTISLTEKGEHKVLSYNFDSLN